MTPNRTPDNGAVGVPMEPPAEAVRVADLMTVAADAARRGGRVLERWFGQSELEVSLKGENDLVSRADRESEDAIVQWIWECYPDHGILGEEGGALQPQQGSDGARYQWIIDPLDGTSNFVHGLPIFCVSIACALDDQVGSGCGVPSGVGPAVLGRSRRRGHLQRNATFGSIAR